MANKTISPFRLLLSELADHITTDDLARMKFSCYDHIRPRRREQITTPEGLFIAIGEIRGSEQEQLDFIGEIFDCVGLQNLRQKIEDYRDKHGYNQRGRDAMEQAPAERRPEPQAPAPISRKTESYPKEDDEQKTTQKPSPGAATNSAVDPGVVEEQLAMGFAAITFSNETEMDASPVVESQHPAPIHNEQAPRSSVQPNPVPSPKPGDASPVMEIQCLAPTHQQVTRSSVQPNPVPSPKPGDASPVMEIQCLAPTHQQVTRNSVQPNPDPPPKPGNALPVMESQPPMHQQLPRNSGQPNGRVPPPKPDSKSSVPPSTSAQVEKPESSNLSPANPPGRRQKDYARQPSSTPVPESGTRQQCPAHLSYEEMKQYFVADKASRLGGGGFGEVYRGCQKYMGRDVVVKQERMQDLSIYDQFKREKKLSYIRHPCIMPVFAICEEKGKPRCIMYPFMVKLDLDKALQKDGLSTDPVPLTCTDRIRIALHAARGLRYLHRQNIVHMDVKPGNILLDESFNARLGDPGLARQLKPGVTHASVTQACGTRGYIDPLYEDSEQFRPVNDVFSFGVVLLRLLTQMAALGKKKRTTFRILEREGALKSPEELFKRAREGKWPECIGKEFATLTIQCLEKDLKKRKGLDDVCAHLKKMLEELKAKPFIHEQKNKMCISCTLETPKQFLNVRSPNCRDSCCHFCQACLIKSQRNPLECPDHGPAEPAIGHQNTFAVLICGFDKNNPEVFEKDAREMYEVLNDNRIIGVRKENIFLITPKSRQGLQTSQVSDTLDKLKEILNHAADNARLFFYFSGHSDKEGNLVCGPGDDVLKWKDLQAKLAGLPNLSETIIILDCCYADGKIATDLLQKGPTEEATDGESSESVAILPPEAHRSRFPEKKDNAESDTSEVDGDPELMGTSGACGIIVKAPDKSKSNPDSRSEPTSIWQMSSSTRDQESLALLKSHSIFTQALVQGLRGGHQCPDHDCQACKKFQAVAKTEGYISAGNLQDFIYRHVESRAQKSGEQQQPRRRTVHSHDIPLAYYNENESLLHDHVPFTFEEGDLIDISITPFPETVEEFREAVHRAVKDSTASGHLAPRITADLRVASVKHIQILCEDDEIDSHQYSDLKQWLRSGYGVGCQLRTPEYILKGPVTWAVPDKTKYTSFFRSQLAKTLGITEITENQDYPVFSIDLPGECGDEDKKEFMSTATADLDDEKVRLLFEGLKDSIPGNLIITVYKTSVHFEFQPQGC